MRRNWIKIYIDQCLRGTMMDEMKDPGERFLWFGFLLLAGDSAYEGKITLTENMGYSNEQLSSMLKCDVKLIKSAKKKMIKFDKIKILENNIIQIVNWSKYQSEYQRQKPYRSENGQKLLRKVTIKGDTQKEIEIKKEKIKEEEEKKYKKEFDIFMKIYDLEVAREDAFKAFKALRRKGVTFQTIKDAVKGYANHLKVETWKKQMYPASFLRNEKWKDFIGIEHKPSL